MDLDEQIAEVEEHVAAGWLNTSVPAAVILASLRELKRLHDVGYSSPDYSAPDDDEEPTDGQ